MPEITIPERVGMNLLQRAALNYKHTCQTCWGDTQGESCANCCDHICNECAVTCSGCGQTDPWCVRCAISRQAFEQRDGLWYCENCPVPEEVSLRKPAAREYAGCEELAL